MKRVAKVLTAARANPKGIRMADLIHLVEAAGYTLDRQKGSHMIFTKPGRPIINLQNDGGNAKPYQVRQVLTMIDESGITFDDDKEEV